MSRFLKPRRLGDVFSSFSAASVLDRLRKQRALLDVVREQLPINLAAHCLDCVAAEDRVVIYTDQPSWSFQLRFHLPALRRALREQFAFQGRIQLRCVMVQSAPAAVPATLPSTEMIASLRQAVDYAAAEESAGGVNAALGRLFRTMASRSQAAQKVDANGNNCPENSAQ